jgi:hypothetical protein
MRAQLAAGGFSLGQAGGDVILIEEDLPLEVVGLDEVAVYDAQKADTRADQRIGQMRPERTAADQQHA